MKNTDCLAGIIFVTLAILLTVFRIYFLPLGPYASPDDFPAAAVTLIVVLTLIVVFDLARDKMTYTYLEYDVRVHKKTGQKQMHINGLVSSWHRSKGWVNLKEENDEVS